MYAIGELVSTHNANWMVLLEEGTFIVSNTSEIKDPADQKNILVSYHPDDQFATYIPMEKVDGWRKAKHALDKLVNELTEIRDEAGDEEGIAFCGRVFKETWVECEIACGS